MFNPNLNFAHPLCCLKKPILVAVSPGVDDKDTTYPGDIIWEGVHKTHPRDCKEILDAGDSHGDGVYKIYNEAQNGFNNVWCNMDCDRGGWLVSKCLCFGKIHIVLTTLK